MKKVYTGYAAKRAIKSAKWTRNKVYFKGEIDVLRLPTICRKESDNKVKYRVTIERL